jgi:hypothetical protein
MSLALMLLLSLAGVAGNCADCFSAGSQHCCTPTCSLCLCCGQGPTILAGAPAMHPGPDRASLSADRQDRGALSAHRRAVFHVPKTYLI